MSEELGKPVRNTFRFGAKIIEWIAGLSIAAVIIENLGFVEKISSIVAFPARKIISILPNLVEIVAYVPFPNFIKQTIANTKMIQDFNLLLNLVAIWAVARLISTIFRLFGAERGKVENIFGIVIKVLIILALLSEGVRFAMGSGTIDLFKGLIPLLTEKGGDVPRWLSDNNLRQLVWVVCSTILGLLVGVVAYRSNIRPGRLRKQELEYEANETNETNEASEVTEVAEMVEPEVSEASEVAEEPEAEPEVSEASEVTEEPAKPEVAEEPAEPEIAEVAEVSEELSAPEVAEIPEVSDAPEEPKEP